MTKSDLLTKVEYFNLVHGVTVRAIGTFDDKNMDFRPQPTMRTPKQIIFHIYTQERILAEAAQEGRFTAEAANASSPENQDVAVKLAALVTTRDIQAYAESCHRAAEDIFKSMSEEDVIRSVESPFGTYPAWRFLDFAYDEHWHHRGQLYVYLRLLGKEPPMLYDY